MTIQLLLKNALIVLLVGHALAVHAQWGCTDPQALNYDAEAVQNDGSCMYPITSYQPALVTNLSDTTAEVSGLAFAENTIWAHNDSGDAATLYRIDSLTGTIRRQVYIRNADNIDWEDLAESETHLYIGDFGNNNGNRTDLRVLKIAKTDLLQDSLQAEQIAFSYPDQTDFSVNPNNHNFDCEAFFYHNGQLHLFSKNWQDLQTKHYTLPDEPGTHTAALQTTFDAGGLITAADIDEAGTIALLGYTEVGTTFMWLLYDYDENAFFSGNKRRIELGSAILNGQVEGIVFQQKDKGYIAAEALSIFPPKLLFFSTQQWTNYLTTTERVYPKIEIQIAPNPVQDELFLNFEAHNAGQLTQLQILNTSGAILYHAPHISTNAPTVINIGTLPSGYYYLRFFYQRKWHTYPFQKASF